MINDGPEAAAMHNELQYTVYQVLILLNFPYFLDTLGPRLMWIHLVWGLKKNLLNDDKTIEH